jgi:hypothetical protein
VTQKDEIMDGIAKALTGKLIDEVAPVLVVTVARVLFIDAEGDKDKLMFLFSKFVNCLHATVEEMWEMRDTEEHGRLQ